jgi:hypothetical protein|nr:MAG TPA: hypothetical protein [Caudoviricetes sp.]
MDLSEKIATAIGAVLLAALVWWYMAPVLHLLAKVVL